MTSNRVNNSCGSSVCVVCVSGGGGGGAKAHYVTINGERPSHSSHLFVQFLALQTLEELQGAGSHPLLPHRPHQQGRGVGQEEGQGLLATGLNVLWCPTQRFNLVGFVHY